MTLHCGVKLFSVNWTFLWYQALSQRKHSPLTWYGQQPTGHSTGTLSAALHIESRLLDSSTESLLTDNSIRSGGLYTLGPVTLNHTGLREERHSTTGSSAMTLYILGSVSKGTHVYDYLHVSCQV